MMKALPEQVGLLLHEFEHALDPAHPESGPFQPRIIGYGEMSTVFAFSDPQLAGHAFKRMPLFDDDTAGDEYLGNYVTYGQELERRGLVLPQWGGLRVRSPRGKTVLYLHQALLDPSRILHRLVSRADTGTGIRLFSAVLDSAEKCLDQNHDALSLGLDGQLSNWCLAGSADTPGDQELIDLLYLDTSTPLLRVNGKEQLDPELFLKVCPQSLVWIIRRFFLADVLERYYQFRLVVLDCVANLYKEGRPDLIVPFLAVANPVLERRGQEALSERDVRAYYREDAFIWSLFLRLRRWERTWRTMRGRPYDLILPGPIRR